MITTSESFATSIAQKTRRTGARVRLDIVHETAVADSWWQSNAASFSDVEQLSDYDLDCVSRVATCEPNFFKLDGTTVVGSAPEIGYVGSALAGADGAFSAPYPVFSIAMSEVFNCQGFSVYFNRLDGEYATSFDIEFYNGSSLVELLEVRDYTETTWEQLDQIDGIDKVIITIYAWSVPYHRARVSEVVFGIVKVWGTQADAGLLNVSTQDEVDITNQSLPYGDATVRIDNRSLDFNILNPVGLAQYIRAGAQLTIRYGVWTGDAFEYVTTGKYLFKSWADAGSRQVNLTALDTIGFFADNKPKLSALADIGLTTVSLAAADLFLESGVSTSRYDISALAAITGSDYLLVPYSDDFLSELRKLAEYCCLVAICDPNGVIKFVSMPTVDSRSIPTNQTKSDHNITQVEQISGVDISIYSKTVGTGSSEILKETRTINGTVTLVYDTGYDYDSVAAAVTGATLWTEDIQAYGKITLTIIASGSVTITITGTGKIEYPAQTLAVENASCTDPKAKRLTIENPHVTTSERAQIIADWVIANYNRWFQFQTSWIGDPSLEVMDQVSIGNRYGVERSAIVTKTVLKYDGGLSEDLEARGS